MCGTGAVDGSYIHREPEHWAPGRPRPQERSVLPGSHAVCGLNHRAAAVRSARGPGDVECHLHAQVRRRRHRTVAQQTRWLRLHFLASVPQLGCRTGGLPQDPRLCAAAGRFCGRGRGHGFASAPDQPQPAARRSRYNRCRLPRAEHPSYQRRVAYESIVGTTRAVIAAIYNITAHSTLGLRPVARIAMPTSSVP